MFFLLLADLASADVPFVERASSTGHLRAYLPGVSLVEDVDGNGTADLPSTPGLFTVPAVPASAVAELAVLHWSASMAQTGAACTSSPDQSVLFGVPGGGVVAVNAQECGCTDTPDPTLDLWSCSADVRALVDAGPISGSYSVGGLNAVLNGRDVSHASAALALWVSDPSFPLRSVHLSRGLRTVGPTSFSTVVGGIDVAGGGAGTLQVYALDGDLGGGERIDLESNPSGQSSSASSPLNPISDPFNSTVTTVSPPFSDTIGTDADAFDLLGLLQVGDSSLAIDYVAGSDTFYVVAQQVIVETATPDLSSSTLSWTLFADADANGVPSNGDTIRFDLMLSNTGNEPATFDIADPMPVWNDGWAMVSAGTGFNDSLGDLLQVIDLTLGAGQSTVVTFDLLIGTPADGTVHVDVASLSAPVEGGPAIDVVAPELVIRVDSDGDGSFDSDDACPNGSDVVDTDNDGTPDGCDRCFGFDDRLDFDGDGVPDGCDRCAGGDDGADTDGDSIPDACDICPAADDTADDDGDGVPDGCDACPDYDDSLDSDLDGTANGCDLCPLGDDRLDIDADGTPDACDRCPAGDDRLDTDGDGTPNACDVCPGGDDSGDADGDTVPDACDRCDGFDDRVDSDFDGVPDGCDQCAGDDGGPDADGDTVADACDICDGADDRIDTDGDGIPNGCDSCDGDPTDTDGDGVPDACDICPLADDRLDFDNDGFPDGCDRCLTGDDRLDADGDHVPDACDRCPGGDDSGDADADGVPDQCDQCDGHDDALDLDGDGVPDACDVCPDFDDTVDADADGIPDACDNCPGRSNPGQSDRDGDGLGDRCDPCPTIVGERDDDGDGTPDCTDCDDNDPALNGRDLDADGVSTCDGDCDDNNDELFPGQAEQPDGRDENCDGIVDEGTVRADDDGDGFSEQGGDCNDDDASIHPGAPEVCDGIDQDCDDLIDEGTPCYDDDGDGYCEVGCVNAGDCNDANPLVNPIRIEVAGNGIDDDCNGLADDTSIDRDGDGTTEHGGDCNDLDANVHPGAVELPNQIDDDCDGVVDEGTVLYDDDGDGFTEQGGDCHDGDAQISPIAIEREDGIDNDCDGLIDNGTNGVDDDGDGYAELAGDCDDDDPAIHPGAMELEDGRDNDCDGMIDEDFIDIDQDGWTFAEGDCNDRNGWVNPGLGEFCDQIDNNCNGEVDEDNVCERTAFGPTTTGSGGCSNVPGPASWLVLPALALLLRRRRLAMVALGAAACQQDVTLNPVSSRILVGPALVDFGEVGLGDDEQGRLEINHVSGRQVTIREVFVTNLNDEHFSYIGPEELIVGSGESVSLPLAFLPLSPGWHTARVEVVHDGQTSPDFVTLRGRGVPAQTRVSIAGVDFGRVPVGERRVREIRFDNEGDAAVVLTDVASNNPRYTVEFVGQREVGPDGSRIFSVEFLPATNDASAGELTFVAGETILHRVALWGNACEAGLITAYDEDGDGHTSCAGDCDDTHPGIHPGAAELPDGVDQNCNGAIDEGTSATDDDGDGYCEAACTDGSLPGDCNDNDRDVAPNRPDVLGNGIDDDCNGTVDVDSVDLDGDGVAEVGGDCDDTNPAIRPGHVELPDGLDNDCDGVIDEGTSRHDDDGDGWCEGATCVGGALPGDCDDTNGATFPGAMELADWRDNDCDGRVDEFTVNSDDDGDGYTESAGDCNDNDPAITPVNGGCP